MKLLIATMLFATLAFVTPQSHANDVGVGIILINPTGFSGSFGLDRLHSIDGALGWGWNDGNQNFYLHSDYLWHDPNLLKIQTARFDVYYGIGGRVIAWTDYPGKTRKQETELGVRGALGSSYTFHQAPFELFGELSLVMNVTPETVADFGLGIGARYHF